MPYILPGYRESLDPLVDGIVAKLCESHGNVAFRAGFVNYTVTRIVLGAMKPCDGWNYTSLSHALAVLRDAAHEIERRMMDQHEKWAMDRNGDVKEFAELYQ